jgi:hypothetical protein
MGGSPEINLTRNFTDIVDAFQNVSYIVELKKNGKRLKNYTALIL